MTANICLVQQHKSSNYTALVTTKSQSGDTGHIIASTF